jgi:hypothetical protein
MSVKWSLGLLMLAACSDGTNVADFQYGAGQPGTGLAEGGEIRHENVRFLGMPEQTWVMVYQYTGPTKEMTAPFAAPVDEGKGIYGNCVDERASATWPFTPIASTATFLDLPKVELSGPGITGTLNVTKTNPPNMVGNSTFRSYAFTYGGGGPGVATGFNASTTTAAMSTPGGHYTVDIGKGAPMDYYIPAAYETPLNIGKVEKVTFPAGQELVLTWTPPANDFGTTGSEHTKKTHFNFTVFADPTNATNPAQFLCFPDVDGHQVITKAVIDAIPANGLMVHANLSHYLEERDGTGTTDPRRFDLVSIYCNISLYSKQ